MVSVIGAFVIGAVLLVAAGDDPVTAYGAMLEGSVGSSFALGETLVRAAPLAIVGLGAALALRAGIFTIGAEGQIAVGAVGAVLAALWVDSWPGALAVPVAMAAGATFGGLWALPPALLRARLGVNEILSTLLFNYFAAFLVTYLLREPLRPEGSIIAQSEAYPDDGRLGLLVAGTRLHWGVLVAVAVAVAFGAWIRSVRGFRSDVFGENPRLARQLGISPVRVVVTSMVLSGAAAGLVGWLQVAGLHGRAYVNVAEGIGFLGLVVAVLGGMRPLGVVAAAVLLSALSAGGLHMEATQEIPSTLSDVLQALVLLGVAARFAPRLWRLGRRVPLAPVLTASGGAVEDGVGAGPAAAPTGGDGAHTGSAPGGDR